MTNQKHLGLSRKFWHELRVLVILIIIAFTIKSTLIEIYIVPTGSMENTIITGDMLIGNKFIYGMRTPTWIGIPYTRIGFEIPWMRLPKYKTVETGDVTIFEFPRDPFQKYVKRCIGTPGDEIEIRKGKILINQSEFPFPEEAKYKDENRIEPGKPGMVFPYFNGNRDNLSSFIVPYKGMEIDLRNVKDWTSVLTLLEQDENEVVIKDRKMTIIDPREVGRTYGFLKYRLMGLFRNKSKVASIEYKDRDAYIRKLKKEYHDSGLYNPWEFRFDAGTNNFVLNNLTINGVPALELETYTIKHDYYFFMGDNRDDSYDSRFWGFTPDYQILGTPLVSIVNVFNLSSIFMLDFSKFFRFEYIN